MSEPLFLVHSQDLAAGQSGELLHLAREQAGWKWMSMSVRRLQPGDIVRARRCFNDRGRRRYSWPALTALDIASEQQPTAAVNSHESASQYEVYVTIIT